MNPDTTSYVVEFPSLACVDRLQLSVRVDERDAELVATPTYAIWLTVNEDTFIALDSTAAYELARTLTAAAERFAVLTDAAQRAGTATDGSDLAHTEVPVPA
jgi:hypothetical protein